MTIELSMEQARAVAEEGERLLVLDPATKQTYRLVREEDFQQIQRLLYDDSEWTSDEMAILAGEVFAKLDNTDYSDYLRDNP